MGALSIAFDTIIVGALACCWVIILIHLFFLVDEQRISDVVASVNKQIPPAVGGVLLFAIAYFLGSVVSRTAQDFFNDDDLHLQRGGYLLRIGVTQDSLRAKVYCERDRELLAETGSRFLAAKVATFSKGREGCGSILRWLVHENHDGVNPLQQIKALQDLAGDMLHLQEDALQLDGEDKTERIRQLHDQTFVLRGAAFNGMIAFSLCLFGWATRFSSKLRWLLPLVYLVPGLLALFYHLADRAAGDPPFMECTLLVLAAAGGYLLWRAAPETKKPQVGVRLGSMVISLFLLTAMACLGWWSTERLYDHLVIDSYYAQAHGLPK